MATPTSSFKLIAQDHSSDTKRWFAFTAPVESGRLRATVDALLAECELIFLIGPFAFIALLGAKPE